MRMKNMHRNVLTWWNLLEYTDIEFTGRVNVKDYLGRMDFTIAYQYQ